MRTHEAGALHADVTEPPSALLVPPADPARLAASVWPATATRDESGALTLGGVDVRDLATEFGTPAFVLDEADFRSRCRDFVQAFAGADVHYAAKAFLQPRRAALGGRGGPRARRLHRRRAGRRAAGRGPAGADRLARQQQVASPSWSRRSTPASAGSWSTRSPRSPGWPGCAEERGRRQPVLVRATVGVEAHTHEFIATAHEDQKFGFSLAGGDAFEACRRVLGHASLELVGAALAHRLADLRHLRLRGRRAPGGRACWPSCGTSSARRPPTSTSAAASASPTRPRTTRWTCRRWPRRLRAIVARECAAAGLAVPRLAVEPGRAIAGPAAVTLYEVGTSRTARRHRARYVSVDGGMSDNIRTALYDAQLHLRAGRPGLATRRRCCAGWSASTARAATSWSATSGCRPTCAPGDLLAVAATGAYCRRMASNYNHLLAPPVVAVGDGAARVIVRRETVETCSAWTCPDGPEGRRPAPG